MDPAEIQRRVDTRQFNENDSGENQPRWGSARFDEQTRLILRMSESGQIVTVDATRGGGVTLGRYDPETGTAPDVDLTPFGAEDLGVSRRHARIDIHEDALRITDLGSANATYLNGLRLTAHQPRILRDGDEVRLGHLKMQVTFVDTPGQR